MASYLLIFSAGHMDPSRTHKLHLVERVEVHFEHQHQPRRPRRRAPFLLCMRWYVSVRYWRQFCAALCIYSAMLALWKFAAG